MTFESIEGPKGPPNKGQVFLGHPVQSYNPILLTWPVSVPHRRGGFLPAGVVTTKVSSAQLPWIPVVVDPGVVTKVSKSILSLQTSVLVGHTV